MPKMNITPGAAFCQAAREVLGGDDPSTVIRAIRATDAGPINAVYARANEIQDEAVAELARREGIPVDARVEAAVIARFGASGVMERVTCIVAEKYPRTTEVTQAPRKASRSKRDRLRELIDMLNQMRADAGREPMGPRELLGVAEACEYSFQYQGGTYAPSPPFVPRGHIVLD